jgi:hypothetical protein
MSLAEYASRPFPVFARLAAMLRNIPAVQFVLAGFAALRRSDQGSNEFTAAGLLGKAPGVTGDVVDRHVATSKSSGDHAIAAANAHDQSGREQLIRRRWTETGSKMWNPDVRGAGHAVLNIQGCAGLLAAKPGEPRYDKLEFKLIGGRMVCEGVVLDLPECRR